MSYNLQDCINKGLIRKIPKSKVRAENSFLAAEKWLVEAESTYQARAYNSSLLGAYLTIFHASRSILYRDGYREKSHYCIARYLEAKYVKEGKLEEKWVNLIDHYREQRHRNQYTFTLDVTSKEAEDAINTAKRVLERLRSL